jgi:hypothetical protein
MIEIVIKNYLSEHLSVPCLLEAPESPLSSYVILEKTGSGDIDHINNSTFAFQSYATSLYEAVMLNEEAKEVVQNLILLDAISKVKLNSDYNFTDTTTKQYRYQAVFDITHY